MKKDFTENKDVDPNQDLKEFVSEVFNDRFWLWNSDRISIEISPEIVFNYSDITETSTNSWFNYIWFVEHISYFFDTLTSIWAIEKVSKIDNEVNYSDISAWNFEDESNYKEFCSECDRICWKYIIYCDIKKINILKKIHNKEKREIWILLLTVLSKLEDVLSPNYDFFHNDWAETICTEEWIEVLNMEIIKEVVLEWLPPEFYFKKYSYLIKSLSYSKNKKYLSMLINYIAKYLPKNELNKLISALNKEPDLIYYSEEEVNLLKSYTWSANKDNPVVDRNVKNIEWLWGRIWNIWYRTSTKKEAQKTQDKYELDVLYDKKTKIFNYAWKSVSLADARSVSSLVEILYNNLWSWISWSEAKKKGFNANLVDTKNNFLRNNLKGFSKLDKKKLICFFSEDREEYIMMNKIKK